MLREKRNNYGGIAPVVLGIVAAIFIIVPLMGFRTVSSGEVAVVTRWGATTGRVLQPGASLIVPMVNGTRYINTKYLIYETMGEDDQKKSESDYKDGAVDTNTKDGQSVDIFYTIRFSIDPTKAVWVVEKFGSEEALVDKIVRAESRSVARVVPSNFEAEELYLGTGKEKVAGLIHDAIKQKFSDNGITLDSVLVRELRFNDEYAKAIENRQIEAVKVGTAEKIAERAEYEKQAAIKQAEARSESQKLESTTLTEQYLKAEWIKRWNGALPMYVTGDAMNLIQIPR